MLVRVLTGSTVSPPLGKGPETDRQTEEEEEEEEEKEEEEKKEE